MCPMYKCRDSHKLMFIQFTFIWIEPMQIIQLKLMKDGEYGSGLWKIDAWDALAI